MYASFLKQAYQLPPKYGLFLGGWLYLCSHKDAPLPGTREMPLEEWVATPVEYTLDPSNHPKLFGRAPGESSVSVTAPAGPAGGAGHGHGHH
jgi:hypothetical protein